MIAFIRLAAAVLVLIGLMAGAISSRDTGDAWSVLAIGLSGTLVGIAATRAAGSRPDGRSRRSSGEVLVGEAKSRPEIMGIPSLLAERNVAD